MSSNSSSLETGKGPKSSDAFLRVRQALPGVPRKTHLPSHGWDLGHGPPSNWNYLEILELCTITPSWGLGHQYWKVVAQNCQASTNKADVRNGQRKDNKVHLLCMNIRKEIKPNKIWVKFSHLSPVFPLPKGSQLSSFLYIYLSLKILIYIMCSVSQLCLTPCNPTDCSQPDSSVHGISQARIL